MEKEITKEEIEKIVDNLNKEKASKNNLKCSINYALDKFLDDDINYLELEKIKKLKVTQDDDLRICQAMPNLEKLSIFLVKNLNLQSLSNIHAKYIELIDCDILPMEKVETINTYVEKIFIQNCKIDLNFLDVFPNLKEVILDNFDLKSNIYDLKQVQSLKQKYNLEIIN